MDAAKTGVARTKTGNIAAKTRGACLVYRGTFVF